MSCCVSTVICIFHGRLRPAIDRDTLKAFEMICNRHNAANVHRVNEFVMDEFGADREFVARGVHSFFVGASHRRNNRRDRGSLVPNF